VIDLGTLGGPGSAAYSTNDAGDIVGNSVAGPFPAASRPTLWRDGTITDLGTLGGPGGNALDINNRGDIVGFSDIGTSNALNFHATVWRNGVIADLNEYRDAATVAAGWYLVQSYDINESGDIVGLAQNTGTGESRGFLAAPVAAPGPGRPSTPEWPNGRGGGGATGLPELVALGLLYLLIAGSRRWRPQGTRLAGTRPAK
jgi:probable HAF family extracellular repeat protein